MSGVFYFRQHTCDRDPATQPYFQMDKLHTLYYLLDLVGTFAFAISGAMAARRPP